VVLTAASVRVSTNRVVWWDLFAERLGLVQVHLGSMRLRNMFNKHVAAD
jgi:hypothetical protein